jgi:molybdopterin molybdotransferase
LIPLDEALQRVLEATPRLPVEERSLAAATGGWLAEPVRLDRDLPAADLSAMDGFAVRAADAESGGAFLAVIGRSRRASCASASVRARPCIMTAAAGGADAVVRIEDTAPARFSRSRQR